MRGKETPVVAEKSADRTTFAAAAYIAELTTELAEIARSSRLDLVAYLLDIVHLEAETAARREGARRRPR